MKKLTGLSRRHRPLGRMFLTFALAGKLLKITQERQLPNLRRAVFAWIGFAFGLATFIPLFPFLFVKGKNPLVVALIGTLIWGILLGVFFFAIFPML